MNNQEPISPGASELAEFRRQIDEFDEQIARLLIERTRVVSRVGDLKRRTAPGICPIRPGREAEQLRHLLKRFENTAFLPAAAAAIWRIIIGASTSVESALRLSVHAPERESELYWLAREYFGPFIPITRQPHVKRVIGDIIDGKSAVGIVPMLRSSDTTYWWTNLMQPGNDLPKIFARVPFVGTDSRDAPTGLAIARIEPEASGDDASLLVLEADHNVSQNRLQMAFNAAHLEAGWINVATLTPGSRHHLVEIKGFIADESHPGLKSLLAALGSSILHVSFLGAYAVPVVLPSSDTKAPPYGAFPSRT